MTDTALPTVEPPDVTAANDAMPDTLEASDAIPTLQGTLVDVASGDALRAQSVADGVLLELPPLGACSIAPLALRHDARPVDACARSTPGDALAFETATGHVLENARLRVELDAAGRLVRVFDREHGREVLAHGRHGNALQVFEDRPLNWDAWDIDAFHEERAEEIDDLVRVDVIESGPLRAALRIERAYRSSRIVQHVRLARDARRLDFVTEVDWHETHTLLKVAFAVAILSPRATYEIQWGSIERPTHRNTSWDFAKFEVAAQQWVDLSEGGYGVALLNDCKYGHDVRDDVMRLSLIRSPTSPDPTSDQGRHRFTYALLPHAGDWREGGVIAEARRLNDPTMIVRVHDRRTGGAGAASVDDASGAGRSVAEADVVPGTGAGTGTNGEERAAAATDVLSRGPFVPVASEARNAVVETIKRAEDGRGFVVRLYEAERRRGAVRLRFGAPPARVFRCDLLETDEEELAVEGDAVMLELGPFEIVTLRVVSATPGAPHAAARGRS